jgi:hypothetical protein
MTRNSNVRASNQGPGAEKRKVRAVVREMRRDQVKRLAAVRYPLGIPDDIHGRSLLKAMLAVGIDPFAIKHVHAPWMSNTEIAKLLAEVRGKYWDSKELGELVGLTDAEREAHGLIHMLPIDKTRLELDVRLKKRKQGRDRKRARQKRAHQDLCRDLDVREEAIVAALSTTRYMPVSKLIKLIASGRAFHGVKLSGKSCTTNSMDFSALE